MYRQYQRAMKDDYIIYSKNKDIGSLLDLEECITVGLDPAIKNFALGIETRNYGKQASTLHLFKFGVKKKVENNEQYFCTDFIDMLDKYKEWWPQINLVVIERQMSTNPDAYRIAQHALTYFLLMCPQAIIVEVNPKLKGKILGAPKGLTYAATKKWGIEIGKELLIERNDIIGLRALQGKGKKDDLCDVICELEAFFIYIQQLFTCTDI